MRSERDEILEHVDRIGDELATLRLDGTPLSRDELVARLARARVLRDELLRHRGRLQELADQEAEGNATRH